MDFEQSCTDDFKDSSDDEISDHDSDKNNRISTKSKVNFSKLNNDEKVMRLQNMANKIKKLKQ